MPNTNTARDGSIIVATVYICFNRLQSAIDRPTGIARLAETSHIRRFVSQTGQQLTKAAEQSLLGVMVTFIQNVIYHSYFYRWLTAEPNPDIIVIDLRETLTVGPLIAGLNGIVNIFLSGVSSSVVTKRTKTTIDIFRNRPIQLASIVILGGVATGLFVGWINEALTMQYIVVLASLIAFALYGVHSETTVEQLQETKTVRLLIAAFEPPEPPTASNQADSSKDCDDATPSEQNN